MSTTTVPGTRDQDDHSVGSYEAAVVHDFHAPLTIEQVPFAPLGPDQIRVQIEACGLCHTDIHAAHGDWPVKPAPPFTPGHEGVGHVVELGSARARRPATVTLGQAVVAWPFPG